MSQKNGTPVDTENGHDGEEQAAETKTASNQAASSDVTGTEKRKTAAKRRTSSDVTPAKDKDGAKSANKKKKLKDDNAPAKPLNGYVRYLNKNRMRAKETNPDLSFADITKLVAAEWTAMPIEEKQIFLDEAEKDKERYARENEKYKDSDSYKIFVKKQQASADGVKKVTKGDVAVVTPSKPDKSPVVNKKAPKTGAQTSLDIPIFTEEFLEHNKNREAELRQMRKWNMEFEEQNAILSKHIENMKSAIEKLEAESSTAKGSNASIIQHLNQLRGILVSSFAGLAIPGTNEVPTADTIESYMVNLHHKLVKNKSPNKENEAVLERVQSIVSQIDTSFLTN